MKKAVCVEVLLCVLFLTCCDQVASQEDILKISWKYKSGDIYLNNKQIIGGNYEKKCNDGEKLTLFVVPNSDEGWTFNNWCFYSNVDSTTETNNPITFSFNSDYRNVCLQLDRFSVSSFTPTVDGSKVFFTVQKSNSVQGILYNNVSNTYDKYNLISDCNYLRTSNNQVYEQQVNESNTTLTIFNWQNKSFSKSITSIPFTKKDMENVKKNVKLSNDLSRCIFLTEDSEKNEQVLNVYNCIDQVLSRKIYNTKIECILNYFWNNANTTIIVELLRVSDSTVFFIEYTFPELVNTSMIQKNVKGYTYSVSEPDSNDFIYVTTIDNDVYRLYAFNLKKTIYLCIDEFQNTEQEDDHVFPCLLTSNGGVYYANRKGIYKLHEYLKEMVISYSSSIYRQQDIGVVLPTKQVLVLTDINNARDLYLHSDNNNDKRISIVSECK